jgi:hypothetical protein
MSNTLNLADAINEAFRSGKTPTFIYNSTTYEFSPAGLIAFMTAEGTLPVGVTASAAELNLTDGLTATTAELNRVADDGQRAVAATVDGLTTGLLVATDNTVVVTSSNASFIVTCPAIAGMAINQSIKGVIGATGCELRTVAASGTTINNVDADGTAQAAIPADTIFTITKASATNFILEVYAAAGTRTIPIPDAP